jgi:hypothetical protein
MFHLWNWLQLQGYEQLLNDNVRWRLNKVHQLQASTIATPITARHKPLNHTITLHP